MLKCPTRNVSVSIDGFYNHGKCMTDENFLYLVRYVQIALSSHKSVHNQDHVFWATAAFQAVAFNHRYLTRDAERYQSACVNTAAIFHSLLNENLYLTKVVPLISKISFYEGDLMKRAVTSKNRIVVRSLFSWHRHSSVDFIFNKHCQVNEWIYNLCNHP